MNILRCSRVDVLGTHLERSIRFGISRYDEHTISYDCCTTRIHHSMLFIPRIFMEIGRKQAQIDLLPSWIWERTQVRRVQMSYTCYTRVSNAFLKGEIYYGHIRSQWTERRTAPTYSRWAHTHVSYALRQLVHSLYEWTLEYVIISDQTHA